MLLDLGAHSRHSRSGTRLRSFFTLSDTKLQFNWENNALFVIRTRSNDAKIRVCGSRVWLSGLELVIARVRIGVCPLRLLQSDREEGPFYKRPYFCCGKSPWSLPNCCLESEVVDASMSRSHVTLYRVSA